MNLSELHAEIGRLLNDPNNQRWSTDVLTTRINYAQTEVQGYTSAVKVTESLTPTSGSAPVTVDPTVMNIIRASIALPDGTGKPLEGITREELDYLYPNWRQIPSGEPFWFWYNPTNQTINLVPPCDDAHAISGAITLYESRVPADLVNSTDIPFDSNNQMIPYHMSIVHWVVAQCWMDDGTPEALAKAKFHKSGSMLHPGEYEKQLGRIMAEFDAPEAVPSHVMWKPQGARLGNLLVPTKSNPLPFQ